MNPLCTFPLPRLLALYLTFGLVAAACSPAATPTPTQLPAPTLAPTQVPTKAATSAVPTAVPTQKPQPTSVPTTSPTLAPTKAPTKAAPTAVPTVKPQSTVAPLALGQAGFFGTLSVMPSAVTQLTSAGADKPKTGNVYVVIALTFANSSKTGAVSVDPTALSVMDTASGKSISAVSLKSLKNQLVAQSLKPGAKVAVGIAFEVLAKDAQNLVLIFNDGKNSVHWTLH